MENHKEPMIDDDLPIGELGDEVAAPQPEEEEQSTIKSVQDLIAAGKQRGYVTEGEILQLVPNPETDLDKLEAIQQALTQARISMRDDITTSVAEVDVMFDEEPYLDDGLNVEGISVNDTVRMYLR